MTETDREWFCEQIRSEEKALYNVAYYMLGNHDDAEDAVAEAVLQGWQSFGRLRDRSYFRAWMMKILKFCAVDMLRKRKQHLSYDDALGESTADDTFEDIAAQEEKERLRKALFRLPEDYRIAITLFYMENYSIKEIAKIMQCTEGTVKSRLSRGRSKLKELLEGGEDNA